MAFHYPNTPDPGPRYLFADPTTGELSQTPPADSNAALATQLRSNLSGALKGDLPPDVVQQIQQHAAEFGVASGLSGSQFAGYQGLKNLGLTSLDRASKAESELVNPLLGYHPLQVLPGTPQPFPQPQSNINWGQSTSPVGVSAINSGGGPAGGRMPAPFVDPRSGWGSPQTNVQSILGDIASKYGPIGATGSRPMGGTLPAYGGTSTGTTGSEWWNSAPELSGLTPEELSAYGNPAYAGLTAPELAELTPEERQDLTGGQVSPYGGSSGFMYAGENPVAAPINYQDTNEDSFWNV
jgi:hypothetical protein